MNQLLSSLCLGIRPRLRPIMLAITFPVPRLLNDTAQASLQACFPPSCPVTPNAHTVPEPELPSPSPTQFARRWVLCFFRCCLSSLFACLSSPKLFVQSHRYRAGAFFGPPLGATEEGFFAGAYCCRDVEVAVPDDPAYLLELAHGLSKVHVPKRVTLWRARDWEHHGVLA